jgi:hypothetical protein
MIRYSSYTAALNCNLHQNSEAMRGSTRYSPDLKTQDSRKIMARTPLRKKTMEADSFMKREAAECMPFGCSTKTNVICGPEISVIRWHLNSCNIYFMYHVKTLVKLTVLTNLVKSTLSPFLSASIN